MNVVINILVSALPLLLASAGALVSELAGIMAVFIDGIINLSAFLFFLYTDIFDNHIIGAILSCLSCMLLLFSASLFTEKTGANPFLIGLAINLLCAGLVSLLSSVAYSTQGVLINELFTTNSAFFSRSPGVVIMYILLMVSWLTLNKTKTGRRIRITGSNPDVLFARGVNPLRYKTFSWVLAALFASLCGIFLVLRVSSFVPNISSGRGWIALAIVFLGRKKGSGTILAVLIFAISEYVSNILQSTNLPSGLFIALPYLVALLLFIIIPSKKQNID